MCDLLAVYQYLTMMLCCGRLCGGKTSHIDSHSCNNLFVVEYAMVIVVDLTDCRVFKLQFCCIAINLTNLCTEVRCCCPSSVYPSQTLLVTMPMLDSNSSQVF